MPKLICDGDGLANVTRDLQGDLARFLRETMGELAQPETRKFIKLILPGRKSHRVIQMASSLGWPLNYDSTELASYGCTCSATYRRDHVVQHVLPSAKVVAAEGKTHAAINRELGEPDDVPTSVVFDFLKQRLAQIEKWSGNCALSTLVIADQAVQPANPRMLGQ